VSRSLIRVQSLSLPARPVEREHELSAETLPKGVLRDKRLDFGDQVVLTAEGEVGFDSLLER